MPWCMLCVCSADTYDQNFAGADDFGAQVADDFGAAATPVSGHAFVVSLQYVFFELSEFFHGMQSVAHFRAVICFTFGVCTVQPTRA